MKIRKILTVTVIMILSFLVACGANDNETSSEKDLKGKSSAEIQQENLDNLPNETESKIETKIKSIKHYKWLDESLDQETITVYAEVENTGDTSVILNDVKITYLDKDGSVISSASDEGPSLPGYLEEGDTGYISAEIEGDVEEYSDLDKIDIELAPEPTDKKIVKLNPKKTKENIGTWSDTNSSVGITGFLENESNIKFDKEEIDAAIGIYDKNDELIAVESFYDGQEISIDAKDESSFEFGNGIPLPPEIKEKADYFKLKAIGVSGEDFY